MRVCVCVHIHKCKRLLNTSNQGPNQHPIAHPHNLSLLCSSYFHSLSPSHRLASAFFCPPPPPALLLLCDGSGGVGDEGEIEDGGRLLGMAGTVQAQTSLRSAECPCRPLPPFLVVMLEGKDKSGRSRIWVPGEQAVTRPLAKAMTLLKY